MASEPRTASEANPRRWSFDGLSGSLASVCLGSLAVIVLAGFLQIRYGAYTMTGAEVVNAVFDPAVVGDGRTWRAFLLGGDLPSMDRRSLVVWNIRLPRVIVGVLVGVNLAVSGAILQAITRNELASPFVLGVSSGAGFAVLLTLVVFSHLVPFLSVIAAVGGGAAFLIVYAIAWDGGTSPVRLVLAGVVVNMVFQSLQRSLFFFADDVGVVQSAMAWITGSLTGTGWEEVRLALLPTALVVGLALVGARQLDVLLLGERTASSLGMEVERVRFLLSGVAVLAAGIAVAITGVVGFFGLVVPHVVRLLVGSDHRRLIVGCVFAGAALLVAADVGARLGLRVLLGSGGQLPVGIVTGLLGGPYFLYLMRKRQGMGVV